MFCHGQKSYPLLTVVIDTGYKPSYYYPVIVN